MFVTLQGPIGLPGFPGNPGLPVSCLDLLPVSHSECCQTNSLKLSVSAPPFIGHQWTRWSTRCTRYPRMQWDKSMPFIYLNTFHTLVYLSHYFHPTCAFWLCCVSVSGRKRKRWNFRFSWSSRDTCKH